MSSTRSLSGVLPDRPARRRRTARLVARPGRGVYQRRRGAPGTPADEDWGTIARLYDLEHPACRGPELAFWDGLATEAEGRPGGTGGDRAGAPRRVGSPEGAEGGVLELAAGTGRVAVALARKGHRVTGLERSPGMLQRARARTARLPAAVASRLTWVQGEMAAFAIPAGGPGGPGAGGSQRLQRFSLVFVAYNSFWLLDSAGAQAACLQAVARHLAPGGRLVIDVFPPNADDREDERGMAQPLSLPLHGRRVVRVKDYTYDPEQGIATSDVRYFAGVPSDAAPPAQLARFRYRLRLAEPAEVRTLLEREGYAVEATYGTYQRGPLTPDSPRAIFVATRKC